MDKAEIFFEIQYEKGNRLVTEEICKNGSKLKVTTKNIQDYINCRIDYLVKTQIAQVDSLKKGLFKIITKDLLKDFNEEQLELILNGRPFIDIDDWQLNTIYKGDLKGQEQIVGWFWDIMRNMDQDQLSKFLQFCTGTSRVPLGGFESLESNRGEIAKFCINGVSIIDVAQDNLSLANRLSSFFNKLKEVKKEKTKSHPIHTLIKAHTCFNRIDLPIYPSKDQLQDSIAFILENEIFGFGIE